MGNVNFGNQNITNLFNIDIDINFGGSSPVDAMSALNRLNNLSGLNDFFQTGAGNYSADLPGAGYIPSPNLGLSGAPAGRGLQTDPKGWPDGAVKTAGGYTIVPEGNTNWSIYAPGQKHGEKAHTRVWGDPHVTEKDGTRWDFTKDSDFVLPDGTRIAADTNYDPKKGNGYSVTTGLTITNGADRVNISDIDKRRPKTGNISNDGYEWRAAHLARGNHDSFHLRGDKENVHWMRERNGQMDGVITGAERVDAGGHKIYDQKVDRTLNAGVSADMQPPPFSAAWGNKIRSQLNDAQADLWGQAFGPLGQWPAVANAMGMHQDHNAAHFRTNPFDFLFGGLPSAFSNFNNPMNQLSMFVDLMQADQAWRQALLTGQTQQNMVWT